MIFSLFLILVLPLDFKNVIEGKTKQDEITYPKVDLAEPKKDMNLQDFIHMHKDNFICAMDYYNELKNSIKTTSCVPLYQFPEDVNADVFMLSIVFPELMRYSEFKDKIETRVTSIMYSCGSDSLLCSIGYMQMKPFFASYLEKCISNDPELLKRYDMFPDKGESSTYKQRYDRIDKLRKPEFQIQYLSAFIDIGMKKYHLENKDIKYQLKILSAAYNAGMIYRVPELEEIAEIKSFPNGKDSKSSFWSYSGLVIDFYNYVTNGFSFN